MTGHAGHDDEWKENLSDYDSDFSQGILLFQKHGVSGRKKSSKIYMLIGAKRNSVLTNTMCADFSSPSIFSYIRGSIKKFSP